ncbi:EscU/YscU/HrcU family type III secretion system export apparatus switch protein [Dyella sp.]|uniref:EscU/YscU/HrcU family type III secretion system export apparatus switch protein n=1 Tax=Dyella sp. TaxID=1869338 RepID=UPI002ED5B833
MADGTEEPTDHKLSEAFKKGDKPHSKDFTTAFSMLAWAIFWAGCGAIAFVWLRGYMKIMVRAALHDDDALLSRWMLMHLLEGLGVVALSGLLFILIPEFIQTQGKLATKRIFFDMSRINPASGLKNLFGISKFVELGTAVVRLLLVGVTCWVIWRNTLPAGLLVPGQSWYAAFMVARASLVKMLALTAIFSLALALIDLLVQRKLWRRRNRMKKEEIKREHKEQDGDPLVRGVRRAMHEEISKQ